MELPFRLVGIGVSLIIAGLLLISKPSLALHAKSLGEILIGLLSALIGLQLINFYLNLSARKVKKMGARKQTSTLSCVKKNQKI